MQKNERYMTDNFPKMNFVGLDGILVQFSQEICENGNSAALAFRQEIEKKNHPYILESSNSLTAAYFRIDIKIAAADSILNFFDDVLKEKNWYTSQLPSNRKLFEIPCVFGTDLAPQFEKVIKLAKLSRAQAISEFTTTKTRVMTIGFSPGQPYAGLLSEKWDVPRLAEVSKNVPQSALVCAIRQLIIFSNSTPTGWHHIGQTAFECFNSNRQQPILLNPGDEITFLEINPSELAQIKSNNSDGLGGVKISEIRT